MPDGDCLFCRIVAGEIPAAKVHEDDAVLAIRDIAPRAPTHILLFPKAHIASAADLTPADGELLGRVFGAVAELAREEGIVPALESAHAIAYVVKLAPKLKKTQMIIANLSGRGDKDVQQVASILGGR